MVSFLDQNLVWIWSSVLTQLLLNPAGLCKVDAFLKTDWILNGLVGFLPNLGFDSWSRAVQLLFLITGFEIRLNNCLREFQSLAYQIVVDEQVVDQGILQVERVLALHFNRPLIGGVQMSEIKAVCEVVVFFDQQPNSIMLLVRARLVSD